MATMKFPYKIISTLSVLIGSLSFVIFFAFVLGGPLNIVDLELDNIGTMLTNTFLSVIFFIQHSLMVRDSIRSKITKLIPSESFYAFHSIISGTTLFSVIILWQESPIIITSISSPYVFILRFLQFISILGLIWGVKSLRDFDPFGRKQISKFIKNQKEEQAHQFVYSGPYNFIRHPFYFFILIMIWAYPIISADRLLFICLWTIWILIGTIFEEKDLVNEIGNEYREYKKKVPMLIPYKIFNFFKKLNLGNQ
jgi:methanethiol S-methyltransferase